MASKRALVLAQAADQHSVITWPLARRVGMTRSSYHRLVHSLGLAKLFEGAHLSPGALATPHARIMGAVLVTGEDAVASHATALRLWGLFDLDSATIIDVTLPHRRRHRTIQGIRVHRTRHLPDQWVTEVAGIPVTSAARSLRDVAAFVGRRTLRNLVIDAEQRGLVTPEQLDEQGRRRRTARGASRYRAVIRNRRSDRSDSGFEADVRRVLTDAGIEVTPGPVPVQCPDGSTLHADIGVVGTDVVLECDGKAFHESRIDFARDRRRWMSLQEAGRQIVWVTVDMLDAPEQLIRHVQAAIEPDSRPETA